VYPHRIRLRGPWEYEPLAPSGPAGRLTLPCSWEETPLGAFMGRVRLRRRFGLPRQLDTFERVWLTCSGLARPAHLALNGEPLGEIADAAELEVTPWLRPRNELAADFEFGTPPSGPLGEFGLEIRCAAFLRDVRCRLLREAPAPVLAVEGELVGASDRPLDLYVLANNATAAYTTLGASPGGTPFNLRSAGLDLTLPPPLAVRVELVNGGVVWHVVEQVVD
jgi:hypothetical protein